MHSSVALRAWIVTAGLVLCSSASAEADVDPSLLAGLQARSIGPAGMSGRTADAAAVPDDSNVIYVGASTGGVWRSTVA
jgi:hypothetical protein